MIPLKTQAIQTALTGNWNKAITLNQELLKENPQDIETLNRIALAYTALGNPKEAKRFYQEVLQIDNQNPIALKNLKRLAEARKNHAERGPGVPVLAGDINTMFLEETGKTKVIELINVAQPELVAHLMTGELLTLQVKRLKIFVLDGKKQYIGMLPDDIGKRLLKFLKGGNTYQTCVKSLHNHKINVFIKETKRMNRFKNQPSFATSEKTKMTISKNYVADDDDSGDSEDDASVL